MFKNNKHFSHTIFTLAGFFLLFPDLLVSQVLNEHVWLYVYGKYIKTSSYADPANDIFASGGVSRGNNTKGSNEDIARWCKNKGCNTVRFSFSTIPDNPKFNIYPAIEENIQNYIDPFVQACIKNELYVILDMHEYFRHYKPKDNLFPTGKTWKDDDVQLWISHWVILAEKYKNEPWVMGYELCNEPYKVSAKFLRESYTKCIKAIRKIDTRHIIFLGNNNSSHAKNMKNVWGPVNFSPDEPYNQAVFVFHEYPNKYNPDKVAAVIDNIQKKYDVPVFCSEFGIEKAKTTMPVEKRKQFETEMLGMFQPRKIGWTLCQLEGRVPNFNSPEYFDIWVAALSEQASFIPGFGNLSKHPEPARLNCGVENNRVPEDKEIAVTAVIRDVNGYILTYANDIVTFNFSVKGTLKKSISVKALRGIAELKLKNEFRKDERITITASIKDLAETAVEITIVKPSIKK